MPPGALATNTAFALTPISRQGLQALTPLGWSPVGAIDVTPHDVSFSSPATLRAPLLIVTGNRPVVPVKWDDAASGWRAVGIPSAAVDSLSVDLATSGQYAWLVADVVPAAPPPAQPGELLGGVDPLEVPAAVTASVDPQPKIAFYRPDVHSDVRGALSTPTPLPSGTLLLARISESYVFNAGSESHPDPFTQDLVFHQTSADGVTLGATSIVTPSQTFDPLAFERGVIGVELRAPSATGRELIAAGVDGAIAASATGETMTVPPGAVLDRVAVAIEGLSANSVGFTFPPEFELVGAVSVEISGGALSSSALLAVPKPPQIFDGTGLLLARIDLVGGSSRLILVGTGNVVGDRIVSATTIPGVTVPLDGVRTTGRYVFIRATNAIGFATGTVFATTGAMFNGALVTSDTLPISSISLPSGAYVAAARLGHALIEARDVLKADRGTGEGTIPSAGGVIALNVRLQSDRPRVLTISPADTAQNVSVATPIVITFSEPISAASITGAAAANIQLAKDGGQPVAGTTTVSGTQTTVTFRPGQPLDPNAAYTVTLAAGIADLSGTTIGNPVVAHFTSLDTQPPPPPQAGALHASIPGSDGLTTVTGTQGTAALHDTVSIANVTRKTFTPVLLNPNGSFSVGVPAALLDKLQLEIVDAAGNKTIVALPRFARTNADGSVATAVDAAGGRIAGPNGIALDIDPDTFASGAIVTIGSIDENAFPAQLTPQQRQYFSFSTAFSLDFGGVIPAHDVHVSIPATSADTPQDRWVVGAIEQVGGQQLFTVADTARVIDGRVMTASPPCPGVQAATKYAMYNSTTDLTLLYGLWTSPGESLTPAVVTLYQPTPSNGFGTLSLPYSLLATPSSAPRLSCVPTITGKVTITPNTQKIVLDADQFTPSDRQIVVVNQRTHATQYFPRNVVEYRFTVNGGPTDDFEVEVVSNGVPQPQPFKVYPSQPGFVSVLIDVDKIHSAVTEVVVRNQSVQPAAETRFPQSSATVRIPVSGGPGDGYDVKALDDRGISRALTPQSIESQTGAGNLVARAAPATIDDNTHVFILTIDPTVNPANRASWVLAEQQVDDALIEHGGFTYSFDADPLQAFAVEVRYMDGRLPYIVAIPRIRMAMTDSVSGRIIRTIDVPAPPPDESVNLGVVSGDTDAPFLTGAPPLLTNFDPATPMTFSFNEGVDAALARTGITVVDDKGVAVAGEVRLTNGNKSATFVPTAPLRLGGKYVVELSGLADGSGNLMADATFDVRVFQPRPIGPPLDNPQFGSIKDLLFWRTSTGDQSNLFAVSSDPNTMLFFNVTNPTTPQRTFGFVSDARPAKATLIRDVEGLVSQRTNPCTGTTTFSGDIAFVVRTFIKSTDSIDSHTTSMPMFDVTDITNPCELGVKLFSQGGSNEPDRTSGAIQGIGYALGVAALKQDREVIVAAAVPPLGLLSANVGDNIGPFSYSAQTREPMVPGDYFDVVATGLGFAAAENSNKTVDFFDASLSLQQSVYVGIPGRRLAYAEGMLIDRNRNGRIDDDEAFNLVFVGGESNSIAILDVTNPGEATVLGTLRAPGAIFELDVDVVKRRLIAGGDRPSTGNDFAVYLFDLSGVNALIGGDNDGDGFDDRIIWQSPAGQFPWGGGATRGMRYDETRRLFVHRHSAGRGRVRGHGRHLVVRQPVLRSRRGYDGAGEGPAERQPRDGAQAGKESADPGDRSGAARGPGRVRRADPRPGNVGRVRRFGVDVRTGQRIVHLESRPGGRVPAGLSARPQRSRLRSLHAAEVLRRQRIEPTAGALRHQKAE